MSHYCDENPEVQSDEKTIQCFYHESQLKLATGAGVFSKGKVDFRSGLLVQTFSNEHPPGPSRHIVGVGCSYGPTGSMIAKVPSHHQMAMVGVNHRALRSAEENKKQNQIDNVIITEGDGLPRVESEYFDFVLANLSIRAGKSVVYRTFKETYQKLKNQGELYAVIQKKQSMSSAKKRMEEIFNNVETVNKSRGHYILKSQKGWFQNDILI